MAAPFRHLANLQVLTLSRNQIKSVGNQALIGLSLLQELDLSDNIISTIQENAFAHLPQLHSIKINSDSLLCDCYLKWFPKWINETKVRGGQARCAHPENLKGRSVTQISYESFTCDDFPKPYILKQPETQITLHGDNVTLFCRAASTSPAEMTFVWKHDDYVVDNVGSGPDCVGRCIYFRSHSFDGKGREVTSGEFAQLPQLCRLKGPFLATLNDPENDLISSPRSLHHGLSLCSRFSLVCFFLVLTTEVDQTFFL